MDFRTKLKWDEPSWQLEPSSRITSVGSCFADHMGRKMQDARLDVHVNPFGVLYNPLSIATCCNLMTSVAGVPDRFFFESGGLWHCWLNDSSFSAGTLSECRERVNRVYEEEYRRLRTLDVLFLTLGTNRCYQLKEEGYVVGNCHKQPGVLFEEKSLTVEQTLSALRGCLDAMWKINPGLRVVWTISPYRYLKYGAHGSQLGKAVLLLAVDELCRADSRCSYFPAYEIVLDELRDYRFYAEDMVHPSPVAVSYIWECLSEHCFSPALKTYIKEWEQISKALSHRPLHPESEAYRTFLRQTLLKLEQLNEKYPNLVLSSEYDRLKDLLKS
ncbi:MAG TPA: GSCFA domain-containing protein [Candidatus Paraprevotella stercorigallinarum]|nr:GSCFA domain-containing protein [Candidatus Paraprevotella stercorigallinarum]